MTIEIELSVRGHKGERHGVWVENQGTLPTGKVFGLGAER